MVFVPMLRRNYILQRNNSPNRHGDKKTANCKMRRLFAGRYCGVELPQFSPMSNSTTLYTSESIAELDDAGWQKNVYSRFDATLRSPHMLFPCPFGIAGHQRGHIRFGFCDAMSATRVAECLNLFLPKSRRFGEFTSLVIFEKPAEVESMEYYHRKFWRILDDLANLDSSPWPTAIPREIDHKSWEFCFRGEPIFALCTTPSHVLRYMEMDDLLGRIRMLRSETNS